MRAIPTFGLAALVAIAVASQAPAQDLSHYSSAPGVVNLDDFFVPPADAGKLIFYQYNVYYATNTFRDAGGSKVKELTITGPGGRPVTFDLNVSVEVWTLAPGVIWSPDWKILGARYAATAMIPIGNPSIAGSLKGEIGRGLNIDQSSWGLGDLYVRPLWLQWELDRLDVATSYGFYAPTGKYKTGANDNVGLGFWGHELSGMARYQIDAARTFAAVVAVVGEINNELEGSEVTPGSHVTFTWGLRKDMMDGWFQLGLLGYDTWQVSDDSGPGAPPRSERVRDSVHAAGVQIGVPKLGLAVKYLHEFRAADRFEGQVVTLFFALPLDSVIDRVAGLFDAS